MVNEKDRSIEGKIVELPSKCSTTVENSLQIDPFYAKQTQFQVSQNLLKLFYDMHIRTLGQLVIQKKQSQFKPNSKPIKPKTNPIKANTKPIQTQFQRLKMKAFAWWRGFTIVFYDFLADFTTLKGANSNPIFQMRLTHGHE